MFIPLIAFAFHASAQNEPIISVETTVEQGEVSEEPITEVEEVPLPMPVLDDQLLRAICSCESGDGKGSVNHYESDGVTPLVGRYTPSHLGQDIGMCQINTKYHLSSATSMGYDIYTPEGNWAYAKHLLQTRGTQPWSASARCWNKQ